MKSARSGYLLGGAVLALVAIACFVWALPARSPRSAQTDSAVATPAPTPTGPSANPGFVGSPADKSVADSASSIASALSMSAEPVDAQSKINVCGKSVDGWLSQNEVRAVDQDQTLHINVTVWRAGAATNAFNSIANAASECGSVQNDPGHDRFVAVASAGDAQQVISAVRVGDVLAFMNTATASGESQDTQWNALRVAEKSIRVAVTGTCADPSTDSQPANAERDPFDAKYIGARKTIALATAFSQPVAETLTKQLSDSPTDAVWQAPKPTVRADLAPFVPGGGGLRQNPPRLVDPSLIVAPLSTQPTDQPDDAPKRPDDPPTQASARIQVDDPTGPGCGWAFTKTTKPTFDQAAADSQLQSMQLKALVKATKAQGDWLVAASSWPGLYAQWVDQKRTYMDWQSYKSALAEARSELADAQRRYNDSLNRIDPGPVAPDPNPEPEPQETPAPSISAGNPE